MTVVRALTFLIAAFAGPMAADPAFQPSPPYHAVFFYPWFPNWQDRGHSPPLNWFSNYLPDPDPCAFDPAVELYRSTDDRIVYWQLRKMAEARIEIAISSWWGRNHKTDLAFRYITTDVMERADNPYPNLRWAIYYELESQGDPTVEQLTADLEYIRDQYTKWPAYLKIDGRPVIFVYAEGRDTAGMAERWAEARRRTGFYTVLKVFPGYRTDPNQPDSWHQYAPANRIDRQNPFSWAVSPGFWLEGEAVRLPRDLAAFRDAVAALVAADVPWKLIQTWNEWGEGTAVEPGEQVIQARSGAAEWDPNGVPFKNLYVEVLRDLLPPLEKGAGTAEAFPDFDRGGVVNALSYERGPVAPGDIVAIFGRRLRAGADMPRVWFNCTEGEVLYASEDQVNVIVPSAAAGQRYAELRLEHSGGVSPTVTLEVVTDNAPTPSAAPSTPVRRGGGWRTPGRCAGRPR